jgi:hypothetical protein
LKAPVDSKGKRRGFGKGPAAFCRRGKKCGKKVLLSVPYTLIRKPGGSRKIRDCKKSSLYNDMIMTVWQIGIGSLKNMPCIIKLQFKFHPAGRIASCGDETRRDSEN